MSFTVFSSRPFLHFPSSLPPFQFNPTPNKTSTPMLPPCPPISPLLSIHSFSSPSLPKPISTETRLALRAAWQPPKYVYPDPIPEFAIAETEKFKGELRKKLLKNKETFGDDIDTVVEVCVEIFREFLHKEYGGPGTLLVEPFTDMLLALKEKKLPGAPAAARAALLWAQNYVDRNWENWTSQPSK